MKTFTQHLNLTCPTCNNKLGFAVTVTGLTGAYGSITIVCDVCQHSHSHNFYGTGKESSLKTKKEKE